MQFKKSLGVGNLYNLCPSWVISRKWFRTTFLFRQIFISLPLWKLPYYTPCIKQKQSVEFARILAIEVSIHCALDARGEWLATGGSSFHSQLSVNKSPSPFCIRSFTMSHQSFHLKKLMSLIVLAKCLDCRLKVNGSKFVYLKPTQTWVHF